MADDADREGGGDDAGVRLAAYARELADGIDRSIAGWVVASVERILVAYRGEADPEVLHLAAEAGARARAVIGTEVRGLLESDIDEQTTTPLAVLRRAVAFPTGVLQQAGVPPVVRDEIAERQFPDDLYDLGPARFGDLDPSLDEIGMRWGAAKAFVFRARHRDGGGS